MKFREEKDRNIHITGEERDILDLMYSRAPGYVKTRSSVEHDDIKPDSDEKSYTSFLDACCYKKDFSDKALNIRCHSKYNSGLSLATYKTRFDGSEKNIRAVEAIALDVDFTGKYEPLKGQPDTVLAILYDAMFDSFVNGKYIPYPTFVDASRHFRLVYVFDKPMYINDKAGIRKRQTALLKRIAKCLSDAINRLDPDFCASPQPLTSTFRKPGSVNRRYINGRNVRGKFVYDEKQLYECRLSWCRYALDPRMEIGHTWSVQELSDIILPTKDGWYDPKFTKSDKASRNTFNKDVMSLMDGRIERLKKRARESSIIGSREKVLFHFANCLLTKGESWREIEAEAEALNIQFTYPLTPAEVRSAITVNAPYRYTEEQFAFETGCTPVKVTETKAYKAKKSADSRKHYVIRRKAEIESGKTKMQERAERIGRVRLMHADGMSRSEIARATGLSYNTVKNYLTGAVMAKDAGKELERLVSEDIRHFVRRPKDVPEAKDYGKEDVITISPEPYIEEDSVEWVMDAIRNADGERVLGFITRKWGTPRYNYDIAVPTSEGISDYGEALIWKASHDAETVRRRHERKKQAAKEKRLAKKAALCKKNPPLYVSTRGEEAERKPLTAFAGTAAPGEVSEKHDMYYMRS